MKQAIGAAVAAVNPQCRFDRAIFVIGHMRCGSTALAHVLCSHAAISGYGEAHVAYRSAAALGVLTVNQLRRRAWKPSAGRLFDKILHSRYDGAPADSFFDSTAIFLIREPEPAIASIRSLFDGKREYETDADAARYYADRLAGMMTLWQRFAPDRRIGLTYRQLTDAPDHWLQRISRCAGLPTPLVNQYRVRGVRAGEGAGDPSASRFASIVPWQKTKLHHASSATLALEPTTLDALAAQYRELCGIFSK